MARVAVAIIAPRKLRAAVQSKATADIRVTFVPCIPFWIQYSVRCPINRVYFFARYIPSFVTRLFAIMAFTMEKLLTLAALGFLTSVTSAQTLGWTPLGCYYHSPIAQPLRYPTVPSLTTDTTIESCQAACAAQKFPISGLEFGYQCWCDTAIQGGATPQAASYCNQQCYGDLTETCGGYKYLNVFQNPAVAPSPTISSPASTWTFSWVIPGSSSSESTSLSYLTTSILVTPTTSSALSISISEAISWTSTYESSTLSTSSPAWTSKSTSSKHDHHTTTPTESSTTCTDTTTTGPSTPSSSSSTKHHHHSSTSGISYTTSTIYSTNSYTITSCPPTVKSCPYGSTTTATISVSTTICPVTLATPAPPSGTTPTVSPPATTQTTTFPPPPPSATNTYTTPLLFTSASVPPPPGSTSAPAPAISPAAGTNSSASVPPQKAPSSSPSVTSVVDISGVSPVPSVNSAPPLTNSTGSVKPKPSPSAVQASASSTVGFGVGDLLAAWLVAVVLLL
ncbi:uncharacterized protein PAC_06474 [Phialocephala subalpina]|uniref:WSC domain-containing protein n=1 Tax=Phialocephala subalpina TaxID=576137 RepID=A0A1L7WUX7_9HELO|nr:uncharacterized protein PAC_06474 [Phialocephala subalpina]